MLSSLGSSPLRLISSEYEIAWGIRLPPFNLAISVFIISKSGGFSMLKMDKSLHQSVIVAELDIVVAGALHLFLSWFPRAGH